MGGNLLITIGALSLLGLLILSTGGNLLNNNVTVTESEVVINGVALAQSLIDEIKTKQFDQNESAGDIESPNDLTQSLGPEAGEIISLPDSSNTQTFSSFSTYNDVDDYNGYSRVVDTDIAENFTVSCVVEYVSVSNPDNTTGNRSYSKRITVTVNSPYFSTLPSLQLKSAITY
jgi:hypothetical protein